MESGHIGLWQRNHSHAATRGPTCIKYMWTKSCVAKDTACLKHLVQYVLRFMVVCRFASLIMEKWKLLRYIGASIGIMEKKMKITVAYWGFYRDNGRLNGNYHGILGSRTLEVFREFLGVFS